MESEPHGDGGQDGAVLIRSPRLRLSRFGMADAADVFGCITPAVARFMAWEPPRSLEEYRAHRLAMLRHEGRTGLSLVIRREHGGECLGMTGLDDLDRPRSGIGIWLKEAAQGRGYGTEAITALAGWASVSLGKEGFTYPVAVRNTPSRRIAERLGGRIVGHRAGPKYEAVIYEIPAWRP